MKSLFIKNMPPELGRRLKVVSIHGGVNIRDMVLVAVEEYLDRIEFGSLVKKHYKEISAKKGQLIVQEDVEFKPVDMSLPSPAVPPIPTLTEPQGEVNKDKLLMEDRTIVELDNTSPEGDPTDVLDVEVPIDNFTKRKGFKRTW